MGARSLNVLSLGALVLVSASLWTPTVQAQEFVDAANAQIRVAGTAPQACRIQSPTTVTSNNASFSAISANSGQVTISQLSSPVTGIAQPSSISLQFAAVCNVAHGITIRSTNGGIAREEGRNVGTFSALVGYNIDARWAGRAVSQAFVGTSSQVRLPVDDGAAGILELDVQVQGGTAPLANGRYSDSLIVELTAAS
jgi:hypothetical protein